MAGLLVSVRSADEARCAVAGGAGVIDIKEPARGSLGRADPDVWSAVRAAVPTAIPLSVALGELAEWDDHVPNLNWDGIRYRKLGLAGSGAAWRSRWGALQDRLGPGPDWIAVAYLDWEAAASPPPDRILDCATATGCVGILFDTFTKHRRPPLDLDLMRDRVARGRANGLLTALAGGLDEALLRVLAPLQPELFAVRGAACVGGDRNARVDRCRVETLARVVQCGK